MKQKFILIILSIFFWSFQVFPQKDTIDIFNLSIEDLMSIKVISPTKTQETIENVPAVLEIITDKDIEKYGFTTLQEALERVTGLFITYDYVSHNISMRGINSGKKASSRTIKIMINGQSIAFRPTSENFIDFSIVPMNMIKRIEVLRGPASTLYGANAFLGIINIITKNASEIKQNTLQILNKNTKSNGIQADVRFKKNHFSVSGGFTLLNENKSGLTLPYSTDVLRDRMSYQFPDINPFERQTIDDKALPISFFISTNFSNERIEFYNQTFAQIMHYSARFYEDNPILNTSELGIYNGFSKFGLKKYYAAKKIQTEYSLSFSKGAYSDSTVFDYSPNPEDYSMVMPKLAYNALELSGVLIKEINDNSNLLFGIDHQRDYYDLLNYEIKDSRSGETLASYKAEGIKKWNNTGIYSQYQNIIISSLKATISARYDFHNIYGKNINYRAALVFNPQKKYSIKLSYGTSFKAPTPVQLFTPSIPYNPISGSIGNPDLAPEFLKTSELAFFLFSSVGIISELTMFYNIAQNIVVEKMLASLPSPVNEHEMRGYGIEYTIKYSKKRFDANLNYSFQNTWFNHEELNFKNSYIFPMHMANFSINYILNKYLSIYLGGKYTGKYLASENNIQGNLVYGLPKDYYLGDYFIFDTGINTRNIYIAKKKSLIRNKPNLNFQIKIKNILNTSYLWPGYYYYDIQAPGRQIWFKVIFKY